MLGSDNQTPVVPGGESSPAPPQQHEDTLSSTLSQLCASTQNSSLRQTIGLGPSDCNNNLAGEYCSRVSGWYSLANNVSDRTGNLTSTQRELLYALAALGTGTGGSAGNLSSLVQLYKDLRGDLELAQDFRELFSDPDTTLCGKHGSRGSSLFRYFTDSHIQKRQADVTRSRREASSNSSTQNSSKI